MTKTGTVGRLALAAAAAALGSQAMAATQVRSASYAAAQTELAAALLEVSRFDPSLGVLDAVSLSFSGSMTASASVANTSAALLLRTVPITVFGGFLATPQAAGLSPVPLIAAGTALGTRTFTILGPGAQTSTGPFTLSLDPAGLSFRFTSAAELAAFTGPGTIGYLFSTRSSASTAPRFTSVALAPSSTSSAALTVVYDYTPQSAPVPEPGSWALLLAGLGVVGGVLRRR